MAALALWLPVSAHAAVRAWLDNTHVAPGDSVQLTLQRDGQDGGNPDLSALQQDFNVLSTSRGSSVQIVNGSTSAQTRIQLTLAPKHAGRLTIPAITWGGDRSPSLTLTVDDTGSAAGTVSNNSNSNGNGNGNGNGGTGQPGGAGATATGHGALTGRNVFIETQVDDRQPYVQAAVAVTIRLYSAQPLYQADLELAPTTAAVVQQVGGDSTRTVVRNGRSYQLLERHYLLFPQHSGDLSIPGPVLNAQVQTQDADLFSGTDPFARIFGNLQLGGLLGTRPIRIQGDAITLHVKPRPAGMTSGYWLPAQQLTLDSQWQPPQLQIRVGDPLTLTLTLKARGLTAAQLPDLSALLTLPDGLKAYPDQATLTNTPQGATLVGTRVQNMTLIASQPGSFTLPALQLQWWDTQADQERTLTLPAHTLTVQPTAGTAISPAAAAPAAAVTAPTSGAASASSAATPAPAAAAARAPESIPSASTDDRDRSSATPGAWRWIGIGALVLWACTLITGWLLWRRSRPTATARAARTATADRAATSRAPPSHRTTIKHATTAGRERNAFRAACRANDAPAARRALLAWAALHWPEAPPAGLRMLSSRLDNAHAAALLQALDRACYAHGPDATSGTGWDGASLMAALAQLPSSPRRATTSALALAPLYPDD